MFKSPIVDWCKLMDGKTKTNSFLKMFITSLKSSAPQLFHECPYEGVLNAKNFTLLKSFLSFYPTGIFKLNALVTIKKNEILSAQIDFTMV
jgi:Protein of unknown function (DUF1091)